MDRITRLTKQIEKGKKRLAELEQEREAEIAAEQERARKEALRADWFTDFRKGMEPSLTDKYGDEFYEQSDAGKAAALATEYLLADPDGWRKEETVSENTDVADAAAAAPVEAEEAQDTTDTPNATEKTAEDCADGYSGEYEIG